MLAIKNSTITKVFFGLGLAAVGLISTPSSASAVSFTALSGYTDADFNNGILTGKFSEVFVAEGRIGDNRAQAGNQEFSINNPIVPNSNNTGLVGGTPITVGNRVWTSGEFVDFSLSYDGNNISYILGGQTLSASVIGNATDIYLRTRAANNSSVFLNNLFLNSVSIGSTSSTGVGGSDIDYFKISGLTQPFTLTGQAKFEWTGTRPNNSALAFQIKVMNTKKTPEPGTLGAMMIFGFGSMVYARRKTALVAVNK